MSDYTPTTEQVREQYTREQPAVGWSVAEREDYFDRWLDALIPAEPTPEMVEAFKAAWWEAFHAGKPDGTKVHADLTAGLRAVLAHLRESR